MIVSWDRNRVIEENWHRFVLRPGEITRSLREIVPEIRAWAEDDGRGEVMIFVTAGGRLGLDYKMYATVAMASENDALLFRLLFDGQIVKKTTRRRNGYT